MRASHRLAGLARAIALAGVVAIVAAGIAAGTPQVKSPTGGTIDTVAVEGTIDVVSPGTISVKAIDGTTQFFRLLERVFVHGKAGTDDELKGLQRGMTVVVHYSGTGAVRHRSRNRSARRGRPGGDGRTSHVD